MLTLYQNRRKVSKMIGGNPDLTLTMKTYQSPERTIQNIRSFFPQNNLRKKSLIICYILRWWKNAAYAMMTVETEQRHLQCSSLSPPLAKASADFVGGGTF